MHSNTLRSVATKLEPGQRQEVAYENRYQTPDWACQYMTSLIPPGVRTVLEPTPGLGNLSRYLIEAGYEVTSPARFEDLDVLWRRFDAVVMNPPFRKSIENQFLKIAMTLSDNVIALLPWFSVINCDSRIMEILEFGFKSVTHLKRNTFPKVRVQPCIMHLQRGWRGTTEFKVIINPKRLLK